MLYAPFTVPFQSVRVRGKVAMLVWHAKCFKCTTPHPQAIFLIMQNTKLIDERLAPNTVFCHAYKCVNYHMLFLNIKTLGEIS